MPEPRTLSRRERVREQTLAEIKEHALAQVAEGGPEALSLVAIARAMGMSGPALYRYFASRDDLLAELVADSYDDGAEALEAAAVAARRKRPKARVHAVAAAYRDWAVAHPHRYRLHSTVYGSGELAPERVIPAAHRSMVVLLDALAAVEAPASRVSGHAGGLNRQLERWAQSRPGGEEHPPELLLLGVLAWTRLHGMVSLEIEGAFKPMGLDAALLLRAEVDQLIHQRESRVTSNGGGRTAVT